MKTTPIFILIVGLLCCWSMVDSQHLRHKTLGIDQGLPTQQILSTHTDSLGFLWIRSQEGLSRYDGSHLRHWDWHDIPTASWDSIHTPICTHSQQLIGTRDGLPYAYPLSCTTYAMRGLAVIKGHVIIHQESSEASQLVAITPDTCWVYPFSLSDTLFTSSPNPVPQSGTAYDLQISSYSSASFLVNIPKKGIYEYSLTEKGQLQGQPIAHNSNSPYTGLHLVSKQAGLWYATANTLVKWGESFPTITLPLSHTDTHIRLLCSNGQQLTYSDGEQVYLYDLETQQSYPITDRLNIHSQVQHIGLDVEGNFCISTAHDGVSVLYQSPFQGYNLGPLGQMPINDLTYSPPLGLWASTANGLYLISSSWSKLPIGDKKSPLAVFAVRANEQGLAYANTAAGMYKIQEGNPSLCHFSIKNSIPYVVTPNGQLISCQAGQILSYTTCGIAPDTIPLAGVRKCSAMLMDDTGVVWLATNNGLWQWKKGQAAQKWQGLPHPKINDLAMDKEGRLYVASDGGLSIIQPATMTEEHFTNLPSLKCRKITLGQDGWVWIYSPDGIYSMQPEQEENTRSLGIPADGVSCLEQDGSGRLWVGTPSRLLSYNRPNAFQKEDAPYLYWEKVWVGHTTLSPIPSSISLSDQDVLGVQFGTLVFRDTRAVAFQYRLQQSAPWQNTPNRELTFSNLSAGNYRLQVRVQKPNSQWSEPLELAFEVKPPIWQRTWFWVVSGVLLLSLLGIYIQSVRRRERHRMATQRRFAELELKALQAQMNPHFVFNTLSAIQHTIIRGNSSQASQSLTDFAQLMRLYLESSEKPSIPLADEVKMLRLYCELTHLCYEEKFQYYIKVEDGIDTEDIEIPTMLVQPYIENAIRHGLLPKNGDGQLHIDFTMEGRKLLCTIKDNGIGRKKAEELRAKSQQLRHSMGQNLTTERADILNHLYQTGIRIQISDLKGRRGNPLGTLVRIYLDCG